MEAASSLASSALLRQGNAQGAPAPRLAALPLLQLPSAVVQEVLSCLRSDDKRSLRLVSKDAVALVDSSIMKLQISRDGPFKGARGVALAPRFPHVTFLKLHAGHSHDRSADNKSFGSLMQGEQWHAVTSLQLLGLSAVAASKAISACPATKACVLTDLWDNAYSFGLLQLLQHTCKALPSLSSLTVSHPLGDKELAALASCQSLATLNIRLGQCSSEGWVGLLSGPVQHLTLEEFDYTMFPSHATTTWAGGMASLTHLTLNLCPYGPPYDMALVQLPPSIADLQVHGTFYSAVIPCSPLPKLTSLELVCAPVGHVELAHIAANCPKLLSLSVDTLQLAPADHAAPFSALTELSIYGHATLATNTRWAMVFPTLRVLELMGDCTMPSDLQASVFDGFLSLERLDAGPQLDGLMDSAGWTMRHCDATALSCLKELRLNASSANVQCLTTMSTLQRLTLVFDRCYTEDLGAVARAFATGQAPSNLSAASFVFDCFDECTLDGMDSYPDEDGFYEFQTGVQLAQIAVAAPCWLMRGVSLLCCVQWQQGAYPCLNDATLLALAAHPTMTHIDLGTCLGDITDATLQHVRRLYAKRGLRITVGT